MPQIIDPIDLIARKKGRDVLLVEFRNSKGQLSEFGWQRSAARRDLIAWLDEKGIGWSPCYRIWNDGLIETPYTGEIYLDVPYELTDPRYQQLQQHLENPDETPRIPGIGFAVLPLELALKNAHHDVPEHRDDW